ncbi:hypothetical protein E2562_002598 [Oryza meyeriana var. granulata]|uniref:DUF4283 domain-containing protein n=1 Tax=Oryza meyeriana var. granulata TaxID=110450 RepID=A0A6G1F2X7_9ORYZ|nr:hypothetical protein E2562_002598 [Oryza meyeriana var. granulata]
MEDFRVGEPALRPASGRCVLSWAQGMTDAELCLKGRALVASVHGRVPFSLAMLVDTLVSRCGVRRGNVRVEVTMPSDFLLTFANVDDGTRVLFIDNFSYGGARLSFRHWNRLVHEGRTSSDTSPSSPLTVSRRTPPAKTR